MYTQRTVAACLMNECRWQQYLITHVTNIQFISMGDVQLLSWISVLFSSSTNLADCWTSFTLSPLTISCCWKVKYIHIINQESSGVKLTVESCRNIIILFSSPNARHIIETSVSHWINFEAIPWNTSVSIQDCMCKCFIFWQMHCICNKL